MYNVRQINPAPVLRIKFLKFERDTLHPIISWLASIYSVRPINPISVSWAQNFEPERGFSLSEGIFKETKSIFYNAQIGLSDLKCFIVAFICINSEGLNARSYAVHSYCSHRMFGQGITGMINVEIFIILLGVSTPHRKLQRRYSELLPNRRRCSDLIKTF